MTLIRVDEVRTAIISSLLSNVTVTSELDDPLEVRELNWKGTGFSYPNIRVQVVKAPPNPNIDCSQNFSGSIYIFSEDASSMQADRIAGIIADEYHGKSLNSENIFFTQILMELLGAIQSDQRTWRSELTMRSLIQRS